MVIYQTISQIDSRAVSVDVSGLPPIPIRRPYTMHFTGSLIPKRVDMRWENGELIRVSASGPKLRKDGTVGLQDGTTHFRSYSRDIQEQPEWVAYLVDKYTPTGKEYK